MQKIKNKKEEKLRSVSVKVGENRGRGKKRGYRIPRICEKSPLDPLFLEIPLNDIDHLRPIVDNL